MKRSDTFYLFIVWDWEKKEQVEKENGLSITEARFWTKGMTWSKAAWCRILHKYFSRQLYGVLNDENILNPGRWNFSVYFFHILSQLSVTWRVSWVTKVNNHYIWKDYNFLQASNRDLEHRLKKILEYKIRKASETSLVVKITYKPVHLSSVLWAQTERENLLYNVVLSSKQELGNALTIPPHTHIGYIWTHW